MATKETSRPTFPHAADSPYPRVTYGLPFYEACAKHIKETFHSQRVYLIASNTLSKKTNFLTQLQQALGNTVVGTWIGIKPHTPLNELLPIMEDMKDKQADCLITLGGGSLSDGGKAIIYGLANGVKTADDFLRLGLTSKIAAGASPGNAPSIPLICIPISLSGGEYSRYSGVTDTRTHLKTMLTHEKMFPNLVILDAELTVSTPMQIWLSSGVRSIDHCVEGFLSKNPTKESDAAALEGLSFLVNGLLRTKGNPEDLDARLQCQLGSNLSMTLLYLKVWKGASHGIGHQLGPQGVGHGETSCILLPAVCKYNAKVNGEKQAILKKVLCLEEAVRKVLKEAGVDEEKADLGDILRAIFNALGMPKSLREVGVGREKLDELATNSLQDHFVHTNPVPLDDKSQVLELLEMVVE